MKRFIYLIRCDLSGHYKIGIAKSIQSRMKQLQTGQSSTLTLMDSFESEYASKIEKALHNRFSYCRLEGEWFEFSFKEVSEFKGLCFKIENNFKFLETMENFV